MIRRYIWAIDPGGAAGVPCQFVSADTGVTSGPSYYEGTVNIVGAAGAQVDIQVTTYTNTNSLGAVKVNGALVFLNNTFSVTLDGAGNGSFVCRIEGNAADTGTIVRAVFTITGVNIGQLGYPLTHQESKVF